MSPNKEDQQLLAKLKPLLASPEGISALVEVLKKLRAQTNEIYTATLEKSLFFPDHRVHAARQKGSVEAYDKLLEFFEKLTLIQG